MIMGDIKNKFMELPGSRNLGENAGYSNIGINGRGGVYKAKGYGYSYQPVSRFMTQTTPFEGPNRKKNPTNSSINSNNDNSNSNNNNNNNILLSCELNKLKIDKSIIGSNRLRYFNKNKNNINVNHNNNQVQPNSSLFLGSGRSNSGRNDDEEVGFQNEFFKNGIKIYQRSTDAITKEQIRTMQELNRDVGLSYKEFNESFIRESIKQVFPRMDQPEPAIPKEFTLLDLRLRAVLAELRATGREKHDLYGAVAKIRMVACVRVGSLLLLPSIFADSHKTDKECATLVISAALCSELLDQNSKCRIGGRRGCSVNAAIKDSLESGTPGTAFWDAVSAVGCFLSYDRVGLRRQIEKYDSVIRDLMVEMDRRLEEKYGSSEGEDKLEEQGSNGS